jgi:hypothetical protein
MQDKRNFKIVPLNQSIGFSAWQQSLLQRS